MWGDAPYQQSARLALPLLVDFAQAASTLTYKQFAIRLHLGLPRNANYVLGSIGATLIELETRFGSRIPPIEAIVVNSASGLPGAGVEYFLRRLAGISRRRPPNWRGLVAEAHRQVFGFARWRDVLTSLNYPAMATLEDTADREEWEISQRPWLGETEKLQLINARRGQGAYRQNVETVERECRVTGVRDPRHLRASHIKPWRDSADSEKLDGFNGLLLAPHVDHLFDRGFLSFKGDGTILISQFLDARIGQSWGLDLKRNVGPFRPEQAKYLQYHREHVFERSGANSTLLLAPNVGATS
jgi:hypothetical protein